MKQCTQCRARFTGAPTRCPLDGAALVDLPDPLIGKWIGGRYRVESKLGSGGMASVYKASHDLLGRKVAIKFLSPELALDPTQKERFLREARATNRIKHENIVDITDYGEEENGIVFLVMELLEGETLAHVIARGLVPPREAIDYVIQTGRALGRAHELEVIHRDLKPENIYVVEQNGLPHVKLLDFGLAHVRNEVRLTALGAIFGTPEYMSPEQARGQPVGPASDLYSLGVVFFELLTGRLPFEGSTAELIVKHLKSSPPSVMSLVPSVPPEIDAVVMKLLSKDPTKRHRDAYHLIDDVTSLLTLLPGGSIRPPASVPAPASRDLDDSGTRPTLSADTVGDAIDTADEHPTTVPVSVRSWIERRATYRRALDVAYTDKAPPAWVTSALEGLDALVDRAVGIDTEMAKIAKAMAEHEQSASDSRDRIGRALDELARDESALLRQVEDLERRIERARQRTSQAASEFQRAWADAAMLVREGQLQTVEAAMSVESTARRATAWRQAMQEIDEAAAQLELRRAARDDVRFQVGQLKGRLGMVNATVEHELEAFRDRASELGAQIAATQEQLAESGATIAQHLMEFPRARPLIAKSTTGRHRVG